MTTDHRIELIFFAHPWSVQLLDEQILTPDQQNVLIEVTTESNLSYLCGKAGTRRPGVLPFFTNPAQADMSKLAKSYPLIPAPLLLAANPKISRETLIHSVLSLETCELACERVFLLVHIYAATDFKPLFPLVDKFHIQLDTADYPGAELVECTDVLRQTHSLSNERWGGIHIGSHWLRKTDDTEHNQQLLMDKIEHYAL